MKNLLLPLALAVSLCAGHVAAQQYTFEILDWPDAVSTTPAGLNAAEEVVGSFADASGNEHGFRYSPLTGFSQLDHVSGEQTRLSGINDQGWIAGWRASSTIHLRNFGWRDGAFVDLAMPGFSGAYSAVSNSGVFVGTWFGFDPEAHGVIKDGQTSTTIDYPGATFTLFQDINDAGIIAGGYMMIQPWSGHGLLYDTNSGTFSVIDMPGADETHFNGINNAGELVGFVFPAGSGESQPVFYRGGAWTTLEIPGRLGSAACTDINDSGTICGWFDGDYLGVVGRHGFLARPIAGGPSSYCSANPSSTGVPAKLRWLGSTSVTANDLVLVAESVPVGQFGVFYYGPTAIQQPFGNGFRCVGAPVFRFPPVAIDASGLAFHELDVSQPPGSAGQVTPGSTWRFQYWFRDPAGGGAGFNLSDALTVPFEQ